LQTPHSDDITLHETLANLLLLLLLLLSSCDTHQVWREKNERRDEVKTKEILTPPSLKDR
jgi:hypothetical protein